MNGAGIFFLCLFLIVILPGGLWCGFVYFRAHRAGLPPPPLSAYNPFHREPSSNYPIAPRRGGVMGWVSDKISGLKGGKVGGGGGYEASRGGQNRGFGPLDPDGAWDDRVGHEADTSYGRLDDYEEQELGLRPDGRGAGGYGGKSMPEYGVERGRSRSRDDFEYVGGGQRGLDRRYDEEAEGENPFGDRAERSELRGVSPRPVEMDGNNYGHQKKSSADGASVKSGGRKSMFHEAM